ncbi:hypothetical protein ABID29_001827 [Streptococcus rupicaprae]|uniref:Phage protein n=1 Tax=Streptococcus rupicaprae TaxID=759619 RepID=A0ABV2FJH4_9STRE
MRYADRVVLITTTTQKELLGEKIVKKESEPIPCFRGGFSIDEQMGIFGNYSHDRFKLYLKGKYDGFVEVKYQGKIRKINGKIHYRNQTVIYL